MYFNKNILSWSVLLAVSSFLLLSILRLTLLRGDKPYTPFPCANSVIATTADAKGQYTAFIVERDCGATTDFARHVFIREGHDELNPEANAAVAIAAGQGLNKVHWQGTHTLIVEYDATETQFSRQSKSWNNVVLEYKVTR